MISSEIALQYSKALFGLKKSNEQMNDCAEALDGIANSMRNVPGFADFLRQPFIKAADKKNFIKKLFQENADPVLLNFLFLLIDKKRIGFLPQIAYEYCKLVNHRLGRLDLEVLTTVPIDNVMKEKIGEAFERQYEKRIMVHNKIDPNILGGVVLKIGNQVMDGSLNTQLSQMKKYLTAANF